MHLKFIAVAVVLAVGAGIAGSAVLAGSPIQVVVDPDPSTVGDTVTLTAPDPSADDCMTGGQAEVDVVLTITQPDETTVNLSDTPTAGMADWSIEFEPTQAGEHLIGGNCVGPQGPCPICAGYSGLFTVEEAETTPTTEETTTTEPEDETPTAPVAEAQPTFTG